MKNNLLKLAFCLIIFAWMCFPSFAFGQSLGQTKEKKQAQTVKEFFSCHGTEPFWSVQISDKEITFESPNDEKAFHYPLNKPKEAAMVSLEYIRIYESQSKDKKSRIRIILLKRKNNYTCTDGMSDEQFTYEVIVEKDGKYYHGCCKK